MSEVAGPIEWFWRGRTLARARQARASEAQRLAAREAADLLDASEVVGLASRSARAQGLLLGATMDKAAEALGWPASASEEPTRAFLAGRSAAGVVERAQRALDVSRDGSAIPEVTDLLALREVVRHLVRHAELESLSPGRVTTERWLRVGVLATILVALVAGLVTHPWWALDEARGARWTASSKFTSMPASGAQAWWPPEEFFFHTAEEESPWLRIDLGEATEVAHVRVVNRPLVEDRAVPLLVEISHDGATWRQVAERTTPFTTWIAEFPATEVRHVRLRVPRRTHLHFRAVQVW